MSELPKGWETTPLADVCRIVRGVTYNKSQASDAPEPGYIPVLRANNIQPPALVHEDLVYVPESCVSPDQMIAAGDIVIAMSSGSRSVVGKAAQSVNQWAGSFGAFCGVLRPFSDMHAGFIGHFCRSKAYRDKTTELAAGVNINNLKPSHFSEIEIPVPPFAEQARIAQALDCLLAQVDTLKARLDALPALIKRFRQSVLSSAISGGITKDWRKNNSSIGTGYDLIKQDSIAKSKLTEEKPELAKKKSSIESGIDTEYTFEIPDSWSFTTWGVISEWITYGFTRPMPKADYGLKLATAKDVQNFQINLKHCGFTTNDAFDQLSEKDKPQKGDLLITKDGSIGRAALGKV